jgi:DNA-binding NtrC family response regulator
MNNPTILITGFDETLGQNLKRQLVLEGFDVLEADGRKNVISSLRNRSPDLVVSGSFQKNINDSLKETREIRRRDRHIPIILITRYSSEERVIAALRAGVNDYFKWPYIEKDLVASIWRNLSEFCHQSDTNLKISSVCRDYGQTMIGQSKPMREIKEYLLKVASTDSTVLITGETGTGKELAAETIHRQSPRHKKPFVCVNCSALPENLVESELFGYNKGAFTGAVAVKPGKFELANKGTVFLDEVGDMNPYAQAKILRTIESKEVDPLGGKGAIPLDLRIIAATNQDPEKLMTEGKFREDLYYRLNVARVHLPPLRERKEDIPLLVNHTIRKLNQRFEREVKGLTDEALETLLHYHWPGNARELINFLEAAFINIPSRRISFMDFPNIFRKKLRFSEKGFTNELDMVLAALSSTNWNKSEAARKLKWSRMKVYRTLKRHKINFDQQEL